MRAAYKTTHGNMNREKYIETLTNAKKKFDIVENIKTDIENLNVYNFFKETKNIDNEEYKLMDDFVDKLLLSETNKKGKNDIEIMKIMTRIKNYEKDYEPDYTQKNINLKRSLTLLERMKNPTEQFHKFHQNENNHKNDYITLEINKIQELDKENKKIQEKINSYIYYKNHLKPMTREKYLDIIKILEKAKHNVNIFGQKNQPKHRSAKNQKQVNISKLLSSNPSNTSEFLIAANPNNGNTLEELANRSKEATNAELKRTQEARQRVKNTLIGKRKEKEKRKLAESLPPTYELPIERPLATYTPQEIRERKQQIIDKVKTRKKRNPPGLILGMPLNSSPKNLIRQSIMNTRITRNANRARKKMSMPTPIRPKINMTSLGTSMNGTTLSLQNLHKQNGVSLNNTNNWTDIGNPYNVNNSLK